MSETTCKGDHPPSPGRPVACHGELHQGHICVLASEKKFEEIRDLVQDPKFMCFNCGRVADAKKNLCNPMPLED